MSAAATPALLAELHHADHIIKVMLRAMTVQQQARISTQLEADGVAGEGITRHHEREAAIKAAAIAPTSASTPANREQLRAIRQQLGDIESQALAGQTLCEICFEVLDRLGDASNDPVVAGAVVRLDALIKATCRNTVLVQESVDHIGGLLLEGGDA